jgi:hypothetical protein
LNESAAPTYGGKINCVHKSIANYLTPDLTQWLDQWHDRSSKAALSEASEMSKPKRNASRLTTKSTDEEIVRWTKSHDVFDRLETGISEVVEDHSDLDEVLREAILQYGAAQYASAAGHEGGAQ